MLVHMAIASRSFMQVEMQIEVGITQSSPWRFEHQPNHRQNVVAVRTYQQERALLH